MKGPLKVGLSLLSMVLLAAAGNAAEVKDPNPPIAGPAAAPESTGGPDAFGYTYADDAETTCAVGGFVDISGTGTSVVSGDDSGAPVTLGAAFDFYGTSVTQIAAATNGYLSTLPSDGGPDLSNDCPLPAAPSTGGGARLYVLHDDLVMAAPAAVLYQYFATCPRQSDRCATNEPCSVFMWNDARHFGGTTSWDFEAILYHTTNDIVYVVGAGNPETGSGSTTGIQTSGGTIGLTYACNTAGSIPDNRRVCFFHPNAVPGICTPNADLSITKTTTASTVPLGANVTFTLTAANAGPGTATGVQVSDTLPAGLAYVSNSCNATVFIGGVTSILWPIGNLASGASESCDLTATVTAGGEIQNTATISSTTTDPVSTNNAGSATITGQQSVLEIPTLDGLGLLALSLGLAGASFALLRRRRTA